ncbi:MAG: chorismate--pyruvate lyase family protein [Gammaproteobacteria bacterium]
MSSNSFLFTREPKWNSNRPGLRHTLPEDVQSWTYEPGSLTKRLRSYYGDTVTVKLLFHQWRAPFLTERRLLGLSGHRYCLTREVLLHAGGTPLILARTIIPEQTIKAAHRNLNHLGTRPLGEVIFSYPDLGRIEMQITRVQPGEWKRSQLTETALDQPVWGRRTIYAIKHNQMLVNEFFLPAALAIG